MSGAKRRLFLCLAVLLCTAAEPLRDLGAVGAFSLTERSGKTITNADLLGKVWIASFQFTRCREGCPQVSATIRQLQKDLAPHPNILFVTFTVDPDHDDTEELKKYANDYGADPERWLFLTGRRAEIYQLLDKSFHLPPKQNEGPERKPGREVAHSPKLVLVDRTGHIRGYYDGMAVPPMPHDMFEENIRKLEHDAIGLAHITPWYLPEDFPRFNATLNAAAAVLLAFGYLFIRRRLVRLHIACMLAAFLVSAVFLASYLYYHLAIKHGQPTYFSEQTRAANPPAWVGQLYLAILASHTLLAAAVAPLAVWTVWLGLSGRLLRHVRIARWTLPLWLYVSITGVVVYWMLYRLYPSP